MSRRSSLAAMLLLAILPFLTASAANDYPVAMLHGKCGAQLKEAIRTVDRPVTLTPAAGLPDTLRIIDSDSNGGFIDRFPSASGDNQATATTNILPPEWWTDTTPVYGDTIARDLHQTFPCSADVPGLKQDYPPGLVITSTHDDGWQVGYGEIAGERVWVYTPPAEYRGDFARCIFYMASLYPVKFWNGLGINIFGDNDYPTLNRYSTSLLLKWHTEDPVDDVERKRNREIHARQGNSNPFVLYPALADHIWGTKAQLPWDESPSTVPDMDPPAVTDTDLRPTYQLTDIICLRSPYVPADASWSIDGVPAPGPRMPASDIGTGIHELRFTATGISGKLKITVR